MNKQSSSSIMQENESVIETEMQCEIFSLTPEMLSIVGGGEGMICIG